MFAPSGKGTGESVSSLWTSMLGLIKMQAGLDVARLDGASSCISNIQDSNDAASLWTPFQEEKI